MPCVVEVASAARARPPENARAPSFAQWDQLNSLGMARRRGARLMCWARSGIIALEARDGGKLGSLDEGRRPVSACCGRLANALVV